MPTTNKPAPVATGTDPGLYNPTVGPVGPLDTAPEPVPAGPGLGTTATVPNTVPVVTAQTETVNVAASTGSSFAPNTVVTNTVVKYLSVSDESVAINSQVTNLNFVGTGVSVANNANAINSVVVTIGGGATYGNSNVVSLLAGFGSNTLSTTGNVTGGNLITGAQVVASGVIQSGTGLSTGGYLSVDGSADLHNTTVTGNLSATGNVTGGYILGNGSQLTGLAATYSNSNVQAYLPTYSGNIGALTVTGNLTVTGTTSTVNTEVVNVSESVVGNIDAGNVRTAGQVSATGNITGNFFIGNGSTLSSVTAANVVGTVANATYATSAGSATTATTAGTANAVAGANVSGTVANATYALTSNAATYSTQATYADTANAVAGANVSGTVANATSAGSATTAGTVTTAAQGNITSVGILTSLSVSGNITAANLGNIAAVNLTGNADTVLYGNGTFALPAASSSYGNANVTTLLGNLGNSVISSTGNITTTGNIEGGYILGNGSQLTGLPASYGNANVVANLAALSSNPVSTTGNVTAGNLLTSGLVSVAGNIIAGNLDAINLVINNISSDDSTLVSVQDGLQVYGNIIADNLGNIASINLDGNVSNVLSGTGTWIAAGGGGGNTGNVTFDDQAVVGTGDQVGAGGLYLAPGTESVGNLQYIRVRGGDVATHIHLDTGNNAYFDQYFGDDGKYVKLANTGNVQIGSNDAVGNSASWTFDTGGNLTFPTGNLVITPVDAYLGNSAVIASQYHNLITLSTGANGGLSSLWVEDYANASTSNIAAVYANPTPGSKIVRIAVGQNGGGGGPNLWDFDASGNLSAPGNVSAVGNITGGNVTTAGLITATGNINAGNILTGGIVSAIGNITGNYIVGNGSTLSSLTASNVSGTVANATYALNANASSFANQATTADTANAVAGANVSGTVASATNATTAGTVTTAAQSNITSVGTLTSVAVTGNVTSGGLTVNGTGVVTGNLQIQGNLIYNNLTNITTANLVFGLANTTTGISANGAGFVVGNTSEASFLYNYTAQTWNSNIGVSAVGNITGGNIVTAGLISAAGNVTGSYIIGNGSQLTGVTAYTNANVAAYLPTYTGNVTAGNVTATANVSGGNVLTGGVVSATGNLTAGNVSATNIVGTLTTASQTNITSVGTLGALTVTANVTGGNLLTGGIVSSAGNVTGGNIRTAGVISATGNITGGNVGATLLSGTTVSATANVVGGNITTAGIITATGNITGGNISATNHTGTTASVTGNITGGNILTAGLISATGNITTANSFVGNLVGTTVSVTGNVTAGNVIINGSTLQATGIINPDYINMTTSAAINVAASGTDLTWDVNNGSSGIAYSAGKFSLTAGKTYHILAELALQEYSANGYLLVELVDGTTNARIGSQTVTLPYNSGFNETNNPTLDVIHTPVANQDVKLRVTGGTVGLTAQLRGGGFTRMSIVQLNPTASLSAVSTISASGNVSVGGNLSVTGTVTASNLSYNRPTAGTAIDLTKQLATLDAGSYTLANGVEGQILYLALRSGAKISVTVTFANIRWNNDGTVSSSLTLTPFKNSTSIAPTAVFCIFTNGAWTISSGDI